MTQLRKLLATLVVHFVLSISLVLLVPSLLLSQAAQNTAYQLLWQKEYKNRIERAIFASEDGKLHPAVAFFEAEIQFLGNSGNVLKIEQLPTTANIMASVEQGSKIVGTIFSTPTIYLSRSGRYVALERAISVTQKHMTAEYEFRILDSHGKQIWRRTKRITSYDESAVLHISDRDGSVAFVRSMLGGIKFVHGDEEKHIANAPYGPRGKFSAEGDYFAAMFREIPARQSLGDSINTGLWVALYDHTGVELWRRQLPGAQVPGNIDISPEGRHIVASGLKGPGVRGPISGISTYLFDKNGNKVPLSEPIRFDLGKSSFSGDCRLVALSKVMDRVVKVFDTKTGDKVFEREFEYRPARILLSGDGSMLVVETHRPVRAKDRNMAYYRHNDGRVFVFDVARAELVWAETFQGQVSYMIPSLCVISSDGKQIAFRFENRLAIYGHQEPSSK